MGLPHRVIFAACGVCFFALAAADFPPLTIDPALNQLPPEVLAFPDFTENYKTRIVSGDYEIWSEEKLARWASAQGLSVSQDSNAGGLNYHRAAIIAAPGLTFQLRRPVTEKGSEFANGWYLLLDLASIRGRDGNPLQSSHNLYANLLECEVFIDGIWYKTIRQGAGISIKSPLKIQIPHIRSSEGTVTVSLRLANHPRNFLFLYDAHLAR
jgi:hypothetical protein